MENHWFLKLGWANFALKLDHFYLKVWPILPLKLGSELRKHIHVGWLENSKAGQSVCRAPSFSFVVAVKNYSCKFKPIFYVYYYVRNHKKHRQLDSFIVPFGIYFEIEEECQEEEK